jgi:hypothetical protein
MELTVNEQGVLQIEKLYNGVTLRTSDNEVLSICMRDSGFEFTYQGKYYSAQDGVIKEVRISNNVASQDENLCSPNN